MKGLLQIHSIITNNNSHVVTGLYHNCFLNTVFRLNLGSDVKGFLNNTHYMAILMLKLLATLHPYLLSDLSAPFSVYKPIELFT